VPGIFRCWTFLPIQPYVNVPSAYGAPHTYAPVYRVDPTVDGLIGAPLAAYGLRVLAFLIDWLIVSAVVTAIGIPLHVFHVTHYANVDNTGSSHKVSG